MYSRKEILINQSNFKQQIKRWLKKDFDKSLKDLNNIETSDKQIIKEKEILEQKFQNIKLEKQTENFFITEKNIYPKYYAWWDEESEKVEILKYEAR